MKLPNWFKILWWVVLTLLATIFLYFQLPDLIHGRASAFVVLTLLVWLGLALCPIFPEINFFGFHLKQQMEELKAQVTKQITGLAADVRSTVSIANYVQSSTQALPPGLPDKTSEELPRRTLKLKILNTLWTKQVNRFDDLSQVWSFRLNSNAAEFFDFREATTKLMREGLVSETGQGQIYLTPAGFEYCKTHYKDFPDEQWWPEDPIRHERLKAVLGRANAAAIGAELP